MKTLEMSMFVGTYIQPRFLCTPTLSTSCKTQKLSTALTVSVTTPKKTDKVFLSESFHQTLGVQQPLPERKKKKKERVFFLDVNPLCYEGSRPSLHSFGRWLSLFLSQVTLTDPVIAVIDGERGSEHRRKLLPSYKAHRRKFTRHTSSLQSLSSGHVGSSHQVMNDVLGKCNVPVIKVDGHEADDVVATLAGQVLNKGFRVVIASPDKDFKQLISEDVQIVMPLPELQRWSFYTLRHYRDQYNCDPQSDLSLRCIVGDEVDGVPGIQQLVPSFGRKTALKLIKKHGSLETLLNAAAIRTVGRPYAQEALKNHADYLRRNYEILALKRDVNVQLNDEWLVKRDNHNDKIALSTFFKYLEESKVVTYSGRSILKNGCIHTGMLLVSCLVTIRRKPATAVSSAFSVKLVSCLPYHLNSTTGEHGSTEILLRHFLIRTGRIQSGFISSDWHFLGYESKLTMFRLVRVGLVGFNIIL